MKHWWLLLLTAALVTGSARAQTPKMPKAADTASTAKVYTYVEEMPRLPGGGGNAAIAMAIAKELRFPPIAVQKQFQGSRILVEFTVTPMGMVSDVHIIKNLDSRLDEEVVRAVRALPRFTPGRQQGVPVNVKFTIPITICLRQ